MTIPYQHNCAHSKDGWCLNCVEKLYLSKYKNANKDLIPKGNYCYTYDESGDFIKCPFWHVRKFNEVEIPWCDHIGFGGLPNKVEFYEGWKDPEIAIRKLKQYFGDKYEDQTGAFLLFDQCKECGENEYTKEEEAEVYGM